MAFPFSTTVLKVVAVVCWVDGVVTMRIVRGFAIRALCATSLCPVGIVSTSYVPVPVARAYR